MQPLNGKAAVSYAFASGGDNSSGNSSNDSNDGNGSTGSISNTSLTQQEGRGLGDSRLARQHRKNNEPMPPHIMLPCCKGVQTSAAALALFSWGGIWRQSLRECIYSLQDLASSIQAMTWILDSMARKPRDAAGAERGWRAGRRAASSEPP